MAVERGVFYAEYKLKSSNEIRAGPQYNESREMMMDSSVFHKCQMTSSLICRAAGMLEPVTVWNHEEGARADNVNAMLTSRSGTDQAQIQSIQALQTKKKKSSGQLGRSVIRCRSVWVWRGIMRTLPKRRRRCLGTEWNGSGCRRW